MLSVVMIATALTVSAVSNDTTADHVLGQLDFTHGAANFLTRSASAARRAFKGSRSIPA
jgi:hypothetical protein